LIDTEKHVFNALYATQKIHLLSHCTDIASVKLDHFGDITTSVIIETCQLLLFHIGIDCQSGIVRRGVVASDCQAMGEFAQQQ
jgi:hypothetical protein